MLEEQIIVAVDKMTRKARGFRSYRPTDLDAMVELDAMCFEAPFRFSREAMRRFVEAENAWVLIAADRKGLVGFCIVHREKTNGTEMGYVVTIDVDERRQGEGIGKKLLADAEMWVRSWKGAGMLLHAFTQNERAVQFYENRDYRRLDVQREFYGTGLDAAIYWKDLAMRRG
jgi:ribosomal-protein-alanine N-acetyltransferase